MAAAPMPRRMYHRPSRRSTSRRPAGAGDIYYVKSIDNSRVVRVADPNERRELMTWLLAGVLIFGLGLAYTLERFALIQNGYTIAELKSKRDALLEANSKLQLEEARLQRPDRIDAYARQNLGLQPTTEGQVVRLEPAMPVAEGEAVVAAARFRMPTQR